MKRLFAFMALLALCFSTKAGEVFYPAHPQSIVVFTNVTFATSNFTQVAATNYGATVTFTNVQACPISTLHTFQFAYTATGTNDCLVYLDRTVDASNWYNVYTNELTATAVLEQYATGKWSQYRWRVTVAATNATATAVYMGQ